MLSTYQFSTEQQKDKRILQVHVKVPIDIGNVLSQIHTFLSTSLDIWFHFYLGEKGWKVLLNQVDTTA